MKQTSPIISIALLWLAVGLTKAYMISYKYNQPGGERRPKLSDALYKLEPSAPDLINQMIVFNVGDFISLENYTRSFR